MPIAEFKGCGYFFVKARHNICPRRNYPFHIVTHNIKWVIISWTDSKMERSRTYYFFYNRNLFQSVYQT